MKKSISGVRVILITMFIAFFTFPLTAYASDFFLPKNVTIDGTTYINGFYGDLWFNKIVFKGDSTKVGIIEFRHVKCKKFDWVGTNGMLYCSESQWEKARKYYADCNNFVYYCSSDSVITTIPNMNSQKFDALMAFAGNNSYNPFSSNKGIKIRRLPLPDNDKSPQLIFYKESKDGFFTSYKGYKFHVIDGKLLLLFFYDGRGKHEELVAVDVPKKLGQYFIKLLK